MGGHVFWRARLLEDKSCGRTCLVGNHILEEDMSYSKAYREVKNVLHDDLFCSGFS